MAYMTHSAAISMMCARGRYAKYTSSCVKRPASLRPVMEAQTAECGMTTPLGAPVVPLVYMMTATSDAAGGEGATALALPLFPFASSVSKACTATEGGSLAFCASLASPPMVTSALTLGQSPAMLMMQGISFTSAITTGASVWFTPYLTPSWPSVA